MVTHAAPPVRRLVLFKHGVAFLEHAGPVQGSFELSFDKDAMNDVLKSFALWVPSGDASVGAVDFDSPEDPVAALRERGLEFAPDDSLRGMLTFLRGRRVRLHASAVGPLEGAPLGEGEVLGLQAASATPYGEKTPHGETITLRTADAMLRVVPLRDVAGVQLLDEAARGELQVLMDKSRAATSRAHRSVRVDVSGAAKALHVAYTVPAPIWRVSYRLVAGREGERETVTVMAWAIVHNPVDRDLTDVQLVLTTGQPVSFVIDLYVPRHVTRTVVQEEVRAGAAPRSFAKAKGAPPPRPAAAPAPMMAGAFGAPGAPMAMLREELLDESVELMAGGIQGFGAGAPLSAATGEQRGEFFEYRLDAPVSLTRGGSAMVPIATAKVDAARQRIWRWGDAPAPDIVLHFQNDTGVVLEEGAAVIYDENGYAGEAMVPFRARGGDVRVSFAKDLSMRCTGQQEQELRFLSITASGTFIMESRERAFVHHVRIENDHARDETLFVELPRQASDKLQVPPDAKVEELAAGYRVAVPVPASGVREAELTIRRHELGHVAVSGVGTQDVVRWLRERVHGAHVPAELDRILVRFRAAEDLERDAAAKLRHAGELRKRQEAQTKQLAVLRDTGEEGQERLSVVREVRRLEAEAGDLERAVAELNLRAHGEREQARRELLQLPGITPQAPPGMAP
jgi:hypothetical protein